MTSVLNLNENPAIFGTKFASSMIFMSACVPDLIFTDLLVSTATSHLNTMEIKVRKSHQSLRWLKSISLQRLVVINLPTEQGFFVQKNSRSELRATDQTKISPVFLLVAAKPSSRQVDRLFTAQ